MLHTVGIVKGTTLGTLRHNDDTRLLRLTDTTAHKCCQLVHIGRFLRNDGSLGTTSNGAVLCQEAGITTHYLDKEDALVGVRRIANSIDTIHDGIHRRVVADGGICAVKVIVDGARQTDDREVELHTEVAGSSQRTITADDDQAVNFLLLTGLVGLLLALGCRELLRTGGLQDRTTTGDDTRNILCRESFYLIIDKTFITTVDTFDCKTVVNT